MMFQETHSYSSRVASNVVNILGVVDVRFNLNMKCVYECVKRERVIVDVA